MPCAQFIVHAFKSSDAFVARRDYFAEAIMRDFNRDHARVLRDLYPAVQPGYYMNKRHWNTITLDGSLSDEELRQLSDESYALVVKGLTRAARQQLEAGAAP